jgi:nucleoid-associated protein YgaU
MRPHLTRSLSAHLREAEDHSRLPFHPACPVCRRDRLAGSLDDEHLVSRRTQAAIAAGLLAFSTGGAPPALASPPDEVTEGTEEVLPGDDRSSSVGFELGGDTDQLPDVASPAPVAPAPVSDSEDAGPLEREPVTDVSESALDGNAAPVTNEPPAEPQPIASQPAPLELAPRPTPVADPADTQTQSSDPGPRPEGGQRRETRRHKATEAAAPAPRSSVPHTRGEVTIAPAATPGEPEPIQAEPAPVTTRVVAHTATGRAADGDRFHTVQQGESLWSIAADVLGEEATVARIAREVHRLWELNDERIGTGQPDLLFAGTRLRLR